MPRRIAAAFALVAFSLTLVQGVITENTFTTVVWRALQALVVSLVVGGTIGVMLEKMLSENEKSSENPENSGAKLPSVNR